jgi:D-lyxose ketol-isomerase
MKRSEVNRIIQNSLDFVEKQHHFLLPPFAHWTRQDWQSKGEECREIITQQLGWDITDFGSGDFRKIGLGIITIRNGEFEEAKQGNGKSYAEKILLVDEGQITPTHFHYFKMEDIINRGGGELIIQLWNSTVDERLDEATPVTASMDGCKVTVPPGGTVTLKPGDSITLPTRLYHKFWGKKGMGRILVGEVSRVNDDYVDNRFYEPVGRFAEIEEDTAPLYLLYDDYKKHVPFLRGSLA